MTTSGQICKMSYTAYCNTYCNMGQPYCNILQYTFCLIVSPLQTNIFIQCGVTWMSESHQKRKKKTEEEKEDEALARDIAKLQIKAYKHFLNVMLM